MHYSRFLFIPTAMTALTLLSLLTPLAAQNLPAAPPAAGQAPVAVPPPNIPVVAPPPPAIVTAPPLVVPPPVPPVPYVPLKSLPPMTLDDANDGVGLAQQITRTRGLQARVIWIDGTANLNRVNTADKITALVAQLKKSGFNTIVFDVKPIVGYTLYPSKFAPKLTSWLGGKTLPIGFDPLAVMVAQAHANGLQIVTSMNVFSEGHRDVKYGPGYDHPEWQTTLCEPSLSLMSSAPGASPIALSDRPNLPPRLPGQVTLYTDVGSLKSQPGTFVMLLDANMRVVANVDGTMLPALSLSVPPGGSALLGAGPAGDWLRQYAALGAQLSLLTNSQFVPISARPEQQVPLMVNPNDPAVQTRILNMIAEVVRGYGVDGVIFDDRMRYAGSNADFSPVTHAQFEAFIGHPVRWPDDILTYSVVYPSLTKRLIPGPDYDAWNVFRTLTIRNWLASAVATVKAIRPTATVSVYAGSWYPDYPALGSNWAADDFSAGLRFLTPSYQNTGFAGLVDWMTTGCYYPPGTIADAQAQGRSAGESVEAAGQFSNRAVNDQTWVYAGIALSNYNGHPELLQRALQGAAASTQGIMVFDLSHNIDQFWTTFQNAFATPAVPPQAVPGLLDDLRRQHAARKAAGTPDPPVILYNGTSGTGL
ncbi:MAG: family 10 glycosylhydrolase [Janthinobacterium lividum]